MPLKEQVPLKVMHSGEWCSKKPHINNDMKQKKILIVGGGLTSAHLALAAIKRGCEKVIKMKKNDY